MKSVLILGCHGYLGSLLYRNLGPGVQVVGHDRGLDFTKRRDLLSVLDWSPDVVVNCVKARKGVSFKEMVKVNIGIPESLSIEPYPNVIQISTNAVFPPRYRPWGPEEHVDWTVLTDYGITKRIGEFPGAHLVIRTTFLGPTYPLAEHPLKNSTPWNGVRDSDLVMFIREQILKGVKPGLMHLCGPILPRYRAEELYAGTVHQDKFGLHTLPTLLRP